MPELLDAPSQERLGSLAASRGIQVGELLAWVEQALSSVSPRSGDPGRELSAAERAVLTEEGLGEAPASDAQVARSIEAYIRLIDEALAVSEASARLGVTTSRVRQLLGARRLYGVKVGHDWRVPRWQFARRRLVPGIEEINEALPSDLHPLAVEGFLSAPKPELTMGGESVSPLAWLSSGGPPQRVAELARDL